MKKTLLAFGTGFLAAVLLISVYAFQTENNTDADIVIMHHSSSGLNISHGNGETRKLDIGQIGHSSKGFKNQVTLTNVLQEYVKQGYSIETTMTHSTYQYMYVLTKN